METAKKPATMGSAVPSKDWPMAAPISEPPTVPMKPMTDDAVPATWPSGSIASELKFEPIQPNWNMASAKNTMKMAKGIGSGPSTCTSSQTKVMAMKPSSEPCDSLRMPNRPTSLALTKEEKAMNSATPAKAAANHAPSP